MATASGILVRAADWTTERDLLRSVREEVFVREQAVPVELEWDEFDAVSRHVLASVDGVAVGTGRLLPDGHIGRMAVLRDWRGRGVGSAMLLALMEEARASGMRRVELNAQTRASGFYARFGFVAQGDEFMDAGIAHRSMWRNL
ncbi:MAG TPA: GNAT family N-acetyltransferase [Burkholderiales bacterium]|nr:GNAT family N-acetyltransferase [Burkholderiales bacterium]